MTKEELIKFLEPFSNDIRIVTIHHTGAISDSSLKYVMVKTSLPEWENHKFKLLAIAAGDGIIAIS